MDSLKLATKRLKEHYEKTFFQHGPNAKGVDWGSDEKHCLRLTEMVSRLIPSLKNGEKILDVGCGYGELINVIKQNFELNNINYIGLDPCENMINKALELFPMYEFSSIPFEKYIAKFRVENIFCCGVFTKKIDLEDGDMYELMSDFFKKSYQLKAQTITLNTMSPLCDFYDKNLFYPDLNNITNIIKEIWGYDVNNFIFETSYLKYEMLIHLKLKKT